MGVSRQQHRIPRVNNAEKFVIRHQGTGLYLYVEPETNVDAYVAGNRNDATGFETERLAIKAGERYSLTGQGFVIESPKKSAK